MTCQLCPRWRARRAAACRAWRAARRSYSAAASQVRTSRAGVSRGRGRCPLPIVERRAAQEAHSRVAPNATTGVSAVGPGVRVGGVAAQRCRPHVNSWLTADRCALRSGGSRDHSVLLPGAGLVIALVAAQAAVQDADEPVAQGTQRLVMGGSPSPAGVVVGAGAG